MRFTRHVLSLLLVGAGFAVLPAPPLQAAPGDPPLVQQMRDEADGKVSVTESPATGRVSFVRATEDLLPSQRAAKSSNGAATKATAYVDKYAKAFGGAGVELTRSAVTPSPGGYTVDFAQTYRGLPVFGSRLRAHVDGQGDLTSVGGFVAPGIDVATTPRLDEAAALAKAKRLVEAAPTGAKRSRAAVGDLSAEAELSVYRLGAIQGVTGRNLLAWVVEVTDRRQVRETVVLDALTGKPVNRYSMIAHDLDRELIEKFDDATQEPETVWVEGDEFPGALDEDQRNEVQGTGEAYWFFRNSFGRDSYDGEGAKMITVNNDPSIDCPNANWNGFSTNYCSGVSSDDTVAHEWGHAYTEYTSGLLYQWQPGAMNEAYSDIWGETVDLLNDRYNESPDTVRGEGDCSKYSFDSAIAISIVAPEEIAGDCVAVKASSGPAFPDEPTEVTLVVGLDEENAAEDDLPTDGCSPFENDDEIAGNWVYVDENLVTGCGADSIEDYYELLGDHAVTAGAVGIIVGGDPEYDPWDMPGATFTIPAAQIDGDSGIAIKSVSDPVRISVGKADVEGTVDSYRWLSGEGDPAFGGAIRDMWNPTCYGDPGKVSDEEYYCATGDSGGVHTNSGVVNHTYALLVDGGTYNGVAVPAIGLDKAAHLFWNTQTQYLTPTSGFAELADGLEASCSDLTGNATLQRLVVGTSGADPDTGGGAADAGTMPAITAADCAAVATVAEATELRVEPVQCEFQPMFQRGTIGCGEGTVTEKIWSEDFEAGLPDDWTQDVEYADLGDDGSGAQHFDATVTTDLPTVTEGGVEHTGGPGVLYFNDKGDAGNYGSCQLDDDDYSSRVGMTTPELTVPEGELARISFDHYVATEVGWDGGNVKVSVDGGDFELVPAGAWLHNAPGGQLNGLDEGNTNPMEGQPSFTGTDGGEPTGAWGSSVIDLSAIAEPGAVVQLRFDFGMDGCNGIDGWYVDNVTLSVCVAPAPPGAVQDLAATWRPEMGSVVATWSAPADHGTSPITGYDISVDGARVLTVDGETTSTPVNVPPGSHEVSVTAVNAAGSSEPASATVDVPANGPSAVRDLTASWQRATDTVRASWQPPSDDGGAPITGYDVYVDGGLAASVAAPATSIDTLTVPPGSHRITVRAVNAAGDSTATTVTVDVPAPALVTPAVDRTVKAKKGVVKIHFSPAPSGPVTVRIKGKSYSGTAVNGVLRIKATKQLRALQRKGKAKVKATVSYPGDATVAPFSVKVTIKLKGKQ